MKNFGHLGGCYPPRRMASTDQTPSWISITLHKILSLIHYLLIMCVLLRIISCAFFLKELFVKANRKCIFTGNYVRAGRID